MRQAVLVALTLAAGVSARAIQAPIPALEAMRTALGGAAALDAISALSVSGSVTDRIGMMRYDLLTQLPDRYLTVRNSSTAGPIPVDATYYQGFNGDTLIRRTDANIGFPPDPGPQTPQAIAARRAETLLRNRQAHARLVLVLLGRRVDSYPLQLSGAGTQSVNGSLTDVVEGRASDGFVTRLYIDATTHLPALIAWQAPAPVMLTTTATSTAAVQNGRVVAQTPPSFAAPPSQLPATPLVTWRVELSDFKTQNGITWPHRWRTMIGSEQQDDLKLTTFKINPTIDPKRFAIGG